MTCRREGCDQPVQPYKGIGKKPKYCSPKCCTVANYPSRETRRARTIKMKYGVSVERYDQMLAAQGGACAICGGSGPDVSRFGVLVIDHDHETGEIRGLLCSKCNSAIGLLGDDLETVQSAARYLTARIRLQEGVK